VYRYNAAASRTSGSQSASSVFQLASSNVNAQGIADPPPEFAGEYFSPIEAIEEKDLAFADWMPLARSKPATPARLVRAELVVDSAVRDSADLNVLSDVADEGDAAWDDDAFADISSCDDAIFSRASKHFERDGIIRQGARNLVTRKLAAVQS
jgi:hypothetical protein